MAWRIHCLAVLSVTRSVWFDHDVLRTRVIKKNYKDQRKHLSYNLAMETIV